MGKINFAQDWLTVFANSKKLLDRDCPLELATDIICWRVGSPLKSCAPLSISQLSLPVDFSFILFVFISSFEISTVTFGFSNSLVFKTCSRICSSDTKPSPLSEPNCSMIPWTLSSLSLNCLHVIDRSGLWIHKTKHKDKQTPGKPVKRYQQH